MQNNFQKEKTVEKFKQLKISEHKLDISYLRRPGNHTPILFSRGDIALANSAA